MLAGIFTAAKVDKASGQGHANGFGFNAGAQGVFQVGQHANDCSDYSQTGIGEAACHGYVVALQDASEELCLWGVYGYEIGLYPVDDSGNKIDNFTNNGGANYIATFTARASGVLKD